MPLLTPKQAADQAAVSLSLIYELCAYGLLTHFRVSRPGKRDRILIDSHELKGFLAGCKQGRNRGNGGP